MTGRVSTKRMKDDLSAVEVHKTTIIYQVNMVAVTGYISELS